MLSDFLQELRRRRVVRVAVMYAVTGWVVVQVAATTFPLLEVPELATRLVLLLVLLGFPLAIGLAWAFDITPDGVQRTPAADAGLEGFVRTYVRTGLPGRPRFWAGRLRLMGGGLLVLAVVVSAAGWFATSREAGDATELDNGLVTVLPFRVSGADPGVGWLREGLVDLISVKLAGASRAVDPRTSLAAARDLMGAGDAEPAMARRISRSLGSGVVLLGSVVGSADRLTVTARLVRTHDGREIAATSLPGSTDSLAHLVDRLVAALISLDAGESEQRLAVLTSTSLPALRSYLEGNALLRHGEYTQAVEQYARALDFDSTFVLAALNIPDAAGMTFSTSPALVARAQRIVRQHRDRLNPADRAYVAALWPETPIRSELESVERWERVAREQPDRPEVWYQLGDRYFHSGHLIGLEDPLSRARAAFERAVALDSLYFIPLQHIVWVADMQGDTAAALREMDRYLARYPEGFSAVEFRLRRARLLGDPAAEAAAAESPDAASETMLVGSLLFDQIGPHTTAGLAASRRALEALQRRAASAADRAAAARHRHALEMNAGRPQFAARALLEAEPGEPLADQRRIYDALFWDGDSVAAHASYRRLRARVPGGSTPLSEDDGDVLCATLHWQLWRGDVDGGAAGVNRLRSAGEDHLRQRLCATTLAALLAHQQSAADADARLAALDSLARTGPHAGVHREHANLTVARLAEARGDLARAYAASRRVLNNSGGQYYRSTFLELEGRLAAALGRRDEAITAWSTYLLMRQDADVVAVPRVQQVREALAALRSDAR